MAATWRARVGGVLGEGRYEVILLVLVAAYVAGAVGADAIAGPSFLAAAVLIAADLLTWQRHRSGARIGWVLLSLAVIVSVTELALVDRDERVWGPIAITVLTAAAATALVVRFLGERHTTVTTIAAAAFEAIIGQFYLSVAVARMIAALPPSSTPETT